MNQEPSKSNDDAAAAESSPSPLPPREGPSIALQRWRSTLAVLVVATVVVLGTWRNYWINGSQDQYDLLLLGRCVSQGGQLYVHAVDDGMPGTIWLNALGFTLGGGRALGAWVLPGVAAAGAIGLLALAIWRLLDVRAARWIGILAAVALAIDLYDGTSIGRAFYAATCNVAAVAMFLIALGSWRLGPRVGLGIGAGLAWAAGLAVSHTGCVGLVAVTLGGAMVAIAVRSQRSDWLGTIGCMWTGFVAGLAMLIMALELGGATNAAWANFIALWGAQVSGISATELWDRLAADLLPLRLHLWFLLVGLIAAVFGMRANNLARATIAVLFVWWVAACTLVVAGSATRTGDWASTFPPMFCLTAAGVYHVGEALKRKEQGRRLMLIMAMFTVVLLLGRPLVQQFRAGMREARAAKADPNGRRNRLSELGEKIRDLVPQHRRIYVLGGNSSVYVHAERSPASAITRYETIADVEAVLNDLDAHYAFALLAPDGPVTLGPPCNDACTRRLQHLLSDYEEVDRASGYTVYVRRSERSPSDSRN